MYFPFEPKHFSKLHTRDQVECVTDGFRFLSVRLHLAKYAFSLAKYALPFKFEVCSRYLALL